jgi:hypothetical protein
MNRLLEARRPTVNREMTGTRIFCDRPKTARPKPLTSLANAVS